MSRNIMNRPQSTLYQGLFRIFTLRKLSIKKNKYFLRLCLSLLPLQFVMTGPASQWQLYFQNGHHNIIVGYLFVLISLSAMIGHYIAPKFSSLFKSRNRYLILTTSVNALMVFAVIFTQIYYLSIIFFLIHVVFMSSEEVTRISYLNDEIKSNNRATVLSIFNTLEALVTIAAYIIIGYIADKYSLSVSWAFSAIVMLVFAIPLFISLDKNQKKNYRGRFFHENRAK
ncbi:MFS transporter [Sporolactobacillus sp. STCC-11]|uniref:MFS transporter n=1 Tax=Sporolactobacillus caesalpiniae TaxID=3230362 RepID=UPI0033917408